MSWKMFIQIVLLIVITAIVLSSAKIATKMGLRSLYGPKSGKMAGQYHMMRK